jgi:hypothetical protein
MTEDIKISSDSTSDSTIDTVTICAFDCSEQNVKRCRKCNRPFCIMHSNHFSPNFCKDCFKELAIIEDKFKRTFDEIGNNGQLRHRVEERTRYYLDGPDWPFLTPWIDSLSDDELKIMWVFHHYIMKLIETENDTRKIEKYRHLASTPVPKLVTTTKTRSVTKVTQTETPETLEAKWRKLGIDENTITVMIDALKTQETKP